MKSVTQHTGILTVIKRAKQSNNGNPRYIVEIDGYTCHTMVDDSLGYSITNFDGCMVSCHIGTHYNTVSIENVKKIK